MLANDTGTVTSEEAVLTVTPDITRPVIENVINLGVTTVRVIFSEPVSPSTAVSLANYALNNGGTISNAVSGADTRTILLSTSPLTYDARR